MTCCLLLACLGLDPRYGLETVGFGRGGAVVGGEGSSVSITITPRGLT